MRKKLRIEQAKTLLHGGSWRKPAPVKNMLRKLRRRFQYIYIQWDDVVAYAALVMGIAAMVFAIAGTLLMNDAYRKGYKGFYTRWNNGPRVGYIKHHYTKNGSTTTEYVPFSQTRK